MSNETREHIRDWWRTDIVNVEDGNIRYRGYAIEDLIGNVSLVETIWLLLRGELPDPKQARLLEATMVASVNAGPMSPSCAIAAMAITCGVGLNNAIASGINALGDTHGGAGQQVMERLLLIRDSDGTDMHAKVATHLEQFFEEGGRFLPGFGHRFHSVDPRAQRLLELIDEATADGVVQGEYAKMVRAMEAELTRRKGRNIPVNVDGAFAAVLAELGFAAPLARGIFVLARAAGLLAHAVESQTEGRRIKGPVPDDIMYTYSGHAPRALPGAQ
ncbi:citryl-CoA lyase [Roseinatronobacter bogoriensis]|uniref:citrate synthase (unknown stereospecificity) n=1 Tax=Roseinatronobacter bogoriensis subsp. barguzinensis TaxID=441209 RepID=A0A2K8KLW3_9RHOB|nr:MULTISPECIES: citryl-CoA lyase [Rhodobaca]ATX67550.1 citryl-CoA lyase [Rhodobaca barguzinensis]MBB4209704.1 citrate synthase [Rhodobaca bogoriensis DSM 18756]TDW33879.1 citrate synthase [Rhodobaca barguzinensis]TDY66271.1 citrate synthase [Rhodobaca bogoriensis DSM 18756]